MTVTPPPIHAGSGLALLVGLLVALPPASAEAPDMRAKISNNLKQSFQFDPESARAEVLDEDGVILMAPVSVQENAFPRGLEQAVAQKRVELSTTFSLKDGGEFIKDTVGGFTVEAKPHQEMIPTKVGAENPIPRWTLLRKSW